MALPTFKSLTGQGQEERQERASTENPDQTLTPIYAPGVDIKRATHARKAWILISCLFFLLSVVFLILTIIGNVNAKAAIRSTYFFKLNLSNIIPISAGTSIQLVNSIARSLGLHDFYQVGLWNFCKGYNGEGITYCSTPKPLYWFNPVGILLNELLAGATIALPADVNNILNLVRFASHIMFAFFLTGVCMNVVSLFIALITLYSRWWSFPFAIWTFIAALLTAVATIIATVMSIVFRNVITSQAGLNIGASLGIDMFVFMWIGTSFSVFGWVIHLCLSCCCASRRDVRTGRRRGSKKAYGGAGADVKKMPVNGERKSAG